MIRQTILEKALWVNQDQDIIVTVHCGRFLEALSEVSCHMAHFQGPASYYDFHL